ncbi:hypothetical protein [Ruminococcus sp. FC2018]|nr:hypothetical protein [Ruminococcus sp. FC2018]
MITILAIAAVLLCTGLFAQGLSAARHRLKKYAADKKSEPCK